MKTTARGRGEIYNIFGKYIPLELGHGFYVIHRLDYSTSGVLMVGFTKEATAQASKLFEVSLDSIDSFSKAPMVYSWSGLPRKLLYKHQNYLRLVLTQ